jgi:hypothetical protein
MRLLLKGITVDRYININLNPDILKAKYGVYIAALCLRIRGYSLRHAVYLLARK